MSLCGDCKMMPLNRCTHVNGRRAATPTTPTDGCGYFTPKQAPKPGLQMTLTVPPVERCPRCQAVVIIDGDNRCCLNCGNAWKGVWGG